MHLNVADINDIELNCEFGAANRVTNFEESIDAIKFSDVYKLQKVLGVGGFGVVCQVACLQTNR